MKKFTHLVLVVCLAVTACQKEISFETPGANNASGGSNGGSTGGGSSTADCKACVYMPVCNGSYYTYFDTLYTSASLVTDTFRFVKDTTIDSKTFTAIYSPLTGSVSYYNCTDGATRLVAYNVGTAGGSTVKAADITFLKANLSVGATWQDKLTNPIGQEVTYKSKIIEKGITRTLNGQTFTDVIHTTQETGVEVTGFGFTAVTTSDYYFAKGVGLIETIAKENTGGSVYQHRVIKSYYIP